MSSVPDEGLSRGFLIVHSPKCVSCKLCEIACSLAKTGKCNPKNARMRVLTCDEEGIYTPTVCLQCPEPECAESCSSSAITRDPKTGAWIVDPDLCIGCGDCALACPFGRISVSKITQKAVKCDLCDGDPVCVKYCPTQAIQFAKNTALR